MTREEAISNLNMIRVAFVEPDTEEQRKLIDNTFDMAIEALEPKTGRYVYKELRKEEYIIAGRCSLCGKVRVVDNFCSCCGAKMQSEDKDG